MKNTKNKTLLFLLIPLGLVFAPPAAKATDTFYCANDQYEIRLAVGSDGQHFTGSLYEKTGGKHQPTLFSKEQLQIASFSWTRRRVHLEKSGSTDKPSFKLVAHGTRGFLEVDQKRSKVLCDWEG